MSRTQWLVVIILSPLILVLTGINLALGVGLVAATQLAWASQSRSAGDLEGGLALAATSTALLDLSLNSPPGRVVDAVGVLDDVRASARVLGAAGDALVPAGVLANAGTGWDGRDPVVVGGQVDLERLPELAEHVTELNHALAETRSALSEVPGTGPLGRRVGEAAATLAGQLDEVAPLLRAADAAMPGLAEALGSQETKHYLLCGLNDAELFGSGGAPLYAALLRAEGGNLTIELSGQLESKLSPGNPPIEWDPVGGPPWYREGKTYPFVNSNFHPDFGIAAQDMTRAWAALEYPEVDGVITMDLNALANILARTGPVRAEGFGEVTAQNVVRKVLVDSYREFGSQEVAERHARNDALAAALVTHLADRQTLVQAVRGVLESIPPRHVQAGFGTQSLQAAVEELAATGTLADESGDLIGAFSQSAPNKLSVFQERTIVQKVTLTGDGDAVVRRRVRITNAVPEGLPGNPDITRSYEALRARLRVAHRVPESATDPTVQTRDSGALVPDRGTGPFPDDRGGQVLWQGHEIAPGDSVADVITYRIPAGQLSGHSYELWADPQAMTVPVALEVSVTPAPGERLAAPDGWTARDGAIVWSGLLDRPLHLVVP